MSFLKSWRLAISTLSPVHVGCGEDYDPTNYVIESNTLYEFEPGAAQKVLTDQDRRELLRIVGNPNNKRMLREVQAFFYQRRQALMMVAKRRVPAVPKLVEFYEGRVGKTVQAEGDGSQLINKLAIGRTFFNPISGAPILPGSSLKGAIRTALLDGINSGKPLQGPEKNLDLQQRLFRYREFEQDPMRLVQLTDTSFLETEGVGSELRFAVNRRRKASKPGENSDKSLAEKGDLYQLLECIPAARFRAFSGQLTIQFVDGVNDNRNRLPALPLRWDAQQIAAACNRFYRPQLEIELEQMQERGYLNTHWVTAIKQLLNGQIKQRIANHQAFLLRVGRHSGAESVTLDGVRNVKIMRGRDQSPDYRPQTTTWWLAASDTKSKTEMLPFGWLLVELQPADREFSNWSEVREQLAELPTEYTMWLNREHQQAEMAMRRQAETKARQEAETVKAALSPEQKAIAELRNWFQVDRKAKQLKPVGRVVGTLNRLLKEGLSWPLADRHELAVLAEEVFSQRSVSGDDKTQRERQAKIQKLREGTA